MDVKFPFEDNGDGVFGRIFRPIAKVTFKSPHIDISVDAWMIVDTGADYTLLPKYYSQKLGISLQKDCAVFGTTGIGGEEKVYFLKRIKVKLGNWERNIPIGFLNRDDIPPLMGRHLFLETFKATFSPNHTLTFTTK